MQLGYCPLNQGHITGSYMFIFVTACPWCSHVVDCRERTPLYMGRHGPCPSIAPIVWARFLCLCFILCLQILLNRKFLYLYIDGQFRVESQTSRPIVFGQARWFESRPSRLWSVFHRQSGSTKCHGAIHTSVLDKIKSIVYHPTQEFHQPINLFSFKQ